MNAFACFCGLLLLLSPLFDVNLPLAGSAWPTSASSSILAMATSTPQQALTRLFTAPLRREWFAPSFLRQIPLRQIQAVLTQITEPLGDFQGVQETADGFEVRFSGGNVSSQILLNAEGQIAELLLQPAAVPISIEEAIATVQDSPHDASLLVMRDGVEVAAVNADLPLAVGSTFKLAVLAALQQQIAAGQRGWDSVATLQPEWKSLPSGMLQDWPDGSPLTLETLATLMISISDNTATDALIRVVGRETVEAIAPMGQSRNQPFLTTREAFTLKNPENAAWLERYRSGSIAERRQILQELKTLPLPPKSLFSGAPVAADMEWFFTARELCDLMGTVADLALMQINPGVASARDWKRVSFKGGSEPGVLNLTTQVQTAAGETYCAAATWNSGTFALNEAALTRLYQSLIAGLKQESP